MKTMENKVVFITGGTSGYGEAMARLFTQEGAKVIIAARKENELAEKSKEIGCDALKMDVTDFDAWGKAKA
ncbi:MAG: SDR family NAD(P)-dependent oxidoreductase, partial [Clostridia bacterium]|nr:SDR family NAD(P)-dependent oxidoreductase [Clostridia bacterium]